MVYIEAKKETEPARILTTIFKDKEEQYYELEVSVPTIEKADLRNAILLMIVGLYIVMLLAFLIIHIWVFRRSMKPFYRLLQWLDANRLGNKYEPLQNPTDIQEFRQLNEAVIQYATHSESLLEQQKQFIGHASHELQTPLAICRNRIEMLMEEEDLSEKQMEELAKTHQTLEHITKLNKSLLLLSKIENHQFSEVTEVNMNEIIHRYMDDYREVYDYMDITLNLEEKGNFNVCMNETLAVVLVTNLLKNAFVHNQNHGMIHIEVNEKNLVFTNSGEEKPLDGTKIFQRFYQGKKKEGSIGLGLAIVYSICNLFKLNIHYTYNNGKHSFTITRP
jgi:signal transduction histidine kinase